MVTFWDMNELTYRTEKIVRRHNGKKTVKIKLHITLTSKKCSDMYEFYDFTKYQKQSAEELLKPEYAQMLSELIGAMDVTGNNVEISDAALRDILDNFPEAVSEKRKATVKTAFSLVGKVSYFWGGKSSAIGWDSRWGAGYTLRMRWTTWKRTGKKSETSPFYCCTAVPCRNKTQSLRSPTP